MHSAVAACIDRRIDWQTDDGRIGLLEWFDDSSNFIRRAHQPAAPEWWPQTWVSRPGSENPYTSPAKTANLRHSNLDTC